MLKLNGSYKFFLNGELVKEKKNQILESFLPVLLGGSNKCLSIQLGTGRTPPTEKDFQLQHPVYEVATARSGSLGKLVGDSVVFDFNIKVAQGKFTETTVITEVGLINTDDNILLSRSVLCDGEQENGLVVGPGDTLEVQYKLTLGFDNKKYHGSVLINGVSHNVVTTMARDVLTHCDLRIFNWSNDARVSFATEGPGHKQYVEKPKVNIGDKEILLKWSYTKTREEQIILDKCTVGLTNNDKPKTYGPDINLPLVQVEFVDKPAFPKGCYLNLEFETTLYADY